MFSYHNYLENFCYELKSITRIARAHHEEAFSFEPISHFLFGLRSSSVTHHNLFLYTFHGEKVIKNIRYLQFFQVNQV